MSRETSGVGKFKYDLIKIFILLLSTRRELASFRSKWSATIYVQSSPVQSTSERWSRMSEPEGQRGGGQFLGDQLTLQGGGLLLIYYPRKIFRPSDIPDASLVSGREWVWNAWEFFRFSNIARWGILILFCSIREKIILTKDLVKWFSWFRCF